MEHYRNAPSGAGPLAAEWKDKPHRLVYDLANEVTTLRANMEYCADLLRTGQTAAEVEAKLRELARQ